VPEVVEALTTASRVLIVPGYGLAVANAQHSIAELTKKLKGKGVQVGRLTLACCCVVFDMLALLVCDCACHPASGCVVRILAEAAAGMTRLTAHKPAGSHSHIHAAFVLLLGTKISLHRRLSLASTPWRAACLAS
jgi:hypothetical protein